MNPVLVGVLVYVIAQLLVGLAVSRHIATESDYLVAGRRLGPILATFSIFATWFGAETCIGASGEVYESGLGATSSDPFGYTICLLAMGALLAAPLWNRKLTTLADLFRVRFSTAVERTAAILMVPTSALWAGAQIRAFGHVLASTTTELEVTAAITISAAVVVIYTVSGGLLADAVTDLVQGIALVIGLVIAVCVVVADLGGLRAAIDAIDPEKLRFSRDATFLQTANSWAVPICGSVVAQELVSRVIACRSVKVARRSTLIAAALYLVVGLIPVFLGLVGTRLFPGVEHGEQVLSLVARRHLPTFLYILFIGALVSAILSTVDSALLAASSLTSHNVIVSIVPTLSERAKLRCARGGVVIFGIVAYVLALWGAGVTELVTEASAFGSAGILVTVCFGLFTGFGGPASALASLIAGTGAWIVAAHVVSLPAPYLASLAAATAAYVAVGMAERARRVPRARTQT